jgi:hypothetical protein
MEVVPMGERGPVPKRSTQRRRRNKVGEDGAPTEPTTGPSGAAAAPGAPPADESWHPVARRWYESLAASGQSRWYEPSDWATAYLLAESMSRDLGEQVVGTTQAGVILRDRIPIKGVSLNAYLKGMSTLLVTEGDRRRARLELERGQADADEEAAVAALDDYRRRITG